jgi:hypothetical protein
MPYLCRTSKNMYDLISQSLGYLASVLLAISLLVNNDIRFRWLNSFGCLAFILYGITISAIPIILTNSLLLVINVYFLIKIYWRQESFDLVEFETNDHLIEKFLEFYKNDIQNYFPDFKLKESSSALRFVVLRDLVIANIFVIEIKNDGIGEVKINYTVPKYRDFKVGRFIFEEEHKYMTDKGVKTIAYRSIVNPNHERFLKIMGFKKPESASEWVLEKNV